MSGRPSKTRRGRVAAAVSPATRRLIMVGAAVAVGAFVVGYGITALSFARGSAPADVVMVPDVREMTLAQAQRVMTAGNLGVLIGDSLPNAAVPAGAVLVQSPLPGQEVSPGTQVRVILSTGPHRPTVPDVLAMPLALATRSLVAAGFDVEIEEAPGEGELGEVAGTVPAAGTPLALPATVRLRVGAQAPIFAMPGLIGMLEEAAREEVEAAGLELVEVFYEATPFGEPGGVTAQDPAPGDSVMVGSGVRIRVSFPTQPSG